MAFRIGFDLSLIILSAVIFAVNRKTLKRNMARLGRVQASWRLGFNFALPGSRLRLFLVLALAGIWVASLLGRPGIVPWLDGLAIIALGAAFFPRYNFMAVGSEGVLDRWMVIPWSSVRERRIMEDRGRKYLELRIAPGPGSRAGDRTRTIPLPDDVSLILD